MRDASRLEGPVFPVPYVPTLGPMYPDTITSDLWKQVIAVSGTGRFLPHDKDARWGGTKVEKDLGGTPETGVATLLDRGHRRTVRLHLYDDTDTDLDQAAKLAAEFGAERAIALYTGPTRSTGDLLAARLDLATAHLRDHDPDGALEQIDIVCASPPEQRTASIAQRVRGLIPLPQGLQTPLALKIRDRLFAFDPTPTAHRSPTVR